MQVNALMDPSGVINDLGKQYIGVTTAPANASQGPGGVVKVNSGYLVTGAPAMTMTLLASVLAGALLTHA
jgi:hypothetical protein